MRTIANLARKNSKLSSKKLMGIKRFAKWGIRRFYFDVNVMLISEIWGSHGCTDVDDCLSDCNKIWTCN
jgi:hypothetical protein